jgi:ribonuclease HII
MTKTPLNKLKPYYSECVEVGLDEVGRGCFSGPLVTAAVILPHDFDFTIVKDSKKLSESQRLKAVDIIKKHALTYSIDYGTVAEIDRYNILQATMRSMHRAIDNLTMVPEHIIVDGNQFNSYKNIPHQCVVKGDAHYYSIAAASILAKVERDNHMAKLGKDFPVYGWASNKGYGTLDHREALLKYGPTEHHRTTFISNYVKQTPKNSLF